jgi:hypothetical protein
MEPGLTELISFIKSLIFLTSLAAVPITCAVAAGGVTQTMVMLAPSQAPISSDNIVIAVTCSGLGGFLFGLWLLPRVYRKLYKW